MQVVGISPSTVQVSTVRRLVVVGATHPNHKAVKLMNHRRPKKRNPSDRRRTPAEYSPLPPPPPEYTLVSSKITLRQVFNVSAVCPNQERQRCSSSAHGFSNIFLVTRGLCAYPLFLSAC
eukprot:jgi/Picsp_1/4260/NSC_01769-R1_---NA---